MRSAVILTLFSAVGLFAEGYLDTPLIPGTQWHVHDSTRPQPPRAEPSQLKCTTTPAPKGAIELITGTDSSANWEPDNGAKGKHWPIKDGVMTATANYIHTKEAFGDIVLHVEWRSAEGYDKNEKKKGQGNSNSGVFFMRTYELQVLDCSKTETYADGMTAALYGQKPPLFNACLPSREWNSYDVEWTAPRFDKDGKVESKAKITVVMNSVKVQDGSEYIGPSSHKVNPPYKAHAAKMPLALQYHGDPVEFRNLWILPVDKATR
jgi:hypothetical protein